MNINTTYPVYLSLTTIPSRFDKTMVNIKKLLDSLTGFEKIILNIPHKYKKFGDFKVNCNIKDQRLIINRCEDLGPITKLVPTIRIIPSECILIIFDDDEYHPEAIKIAAEKQDKEHFKSFTFWKYTYKNISVPQGVDIISFWKPNLNDFNEFYSNSKGNNHCFYVDDLVIGWYLKHKGIEIETLERKWKWPWIEGSQKGYSLFGLKGEYSRNNSMSNCYSHINNFYSTNK
jgi:hypothetical protein